MHRLTISIVTPCLNQVGTLERAIRSVLSQADGAVEYIIIDGGSTDGTRAVIERYADQLSGWVSEPDRGQSHALNKGFARATGQVFAWLNADDELAPGALTVVRRYFARGDCDVLCGACRYVYPDGRQRVARVTAGDLNLLTVDDPIHQPSCFWRRDWHERVGGLDKRLHFGMDWDLWLRLQRAGARFVTTDEVLSVYHMTGANKTSVGGRRRNAELYELLKRYNHGDWRLLTEIAYRLLWPLKRLRRGQPQWLCRPLSDLARTGLWVSLGPIFGFQRVRRCTHPFC